MKEASPFSPRMLTALAGAGVVIFAICVFLGVYGGGNLGAGAGANSHSKSAIGHAGWFEMLRRLDVHVLRGRADALDKAGDDGVLVLAEPQLAYLSGEDAYRLSLARTMLLVLPKWRGVADERRPGWISEVDRRPPTDARAVARIVDGNAEIAFAPAPQWSANPLPATPAFEGTVQLLRSPAVTPVIAAKDGILLGRIDKGGRTIWILSDPDPIENHGLTRPGNAAFAAALIAHVNAGRGNVVFDETVHGVRAPQDNPFRLLFEFPLVLVTIQAVIALVLLLLAAMARFGKAETAPPPLNFGKANLIASSASLLDHGGHQASILRRYLAVALHDAGRVLHAPAGLDEPALARWLDRLAAARGIDLRAADILARVERPGPAKADLTVLFAAARDMHRWKGDLLNGAR